MVKDNKALGKRIILVLLANYLLAFSTALLKLSSCGTDPFSCMNLGVSSVLGVNYGTYQMIFNIIIFIPVFLLDRESFGIGGLINMFLLGYFVDFTTWLFSLGGITVESLEGNLPIRAVLLIVGVILICFAVALYMGCDLGAAPYDRISVIVERLTKGKLPFRFGRIILDCISITIGYLSGSVVGVGTIVIGFFTGPLVSFFRTHMVEPIIRKVTETA